MFYRNWNKIIVSRIKVLSFKTKVEFAVPRDCCCWKWSKDIPGGEHTHARPQTQGKERLREREETCTFSKKSHCGQIFKHVVSFECDNCREIVLSFADGFWNPNYFAKERVIRTCEKGDNSLRQLKKNNNNGCCWLRHCRAAHDVVEHLVNYYFFYFLFNTVNFSPICRIG